MLKINAFYQLKNIQCEIRLETRITGLILLTGESGIGKTSFLKSLAGLSQPDDYYLSLDNKIIENKETNTYIPSHKRKIVYLFQQANLLAHLNIYKNLLFSYKRSDKSKYNLQDIIKLFELEQYLNKKPGELSGGEKQKVAMAQAILSHPKLLLLDEPLSALDQENKVKIISAIELVINKYQIPVIYVTHQPEEIEHLATQKFKLHKTGLVNVVGNGEQLINNDKSNSGSSVRYLRHMPVIGLAGQEKLFNSKVLCVGAGGLASGILPYLAASGVGEIGIIDGDKIELSNLQRQVLFQESQIGLSKAVCAGEYIAKLNSFVKLNVFQEFLSYENSLEIIKNYDLVIDATDNFKTRYILNDQTKKLHMPLVSASIYQFEAQISVFNFKNGPCYECLYPNAPAPGSIPNCSQAGVLGVLPGVIGGMQASEAIKILLNKGDILTGKLLYVDLLTNQFHQLELAKSQNCKPQHGKLGALLSSVKSYSVEQVKKILEQEPHDHQIVLIDVRELNEREKGHMGGIHNPMSSFDIDLVPKNKSLIIYCHLGIRSRSVAEYLVQLGYQDVANLEGGITAWWRLMQ